MYLKPLILPHYMYYVFQPLTLPRCYVSQTPNFTSFLCISTPNFASLYVSQTLNVASLFFVTNPFLRYYKSQPLTLPHCFVSQIPNFAWLICISTPNFASLFCISNPSRCPIVMILTHYVSQTPNFDSSLCISNP